MKKKIIILSGAVFIIVSILAMLAFVFTGHGGEKREVVDIQGTWEVAASVENEAIVFAEHEFMVFDSEMAYDYKEDQSAPYASSKYKIEYGEDITLQLPDLERSYVMEMKSENYICLYESPDKHMRLIRYPNEERADVQVDGSSLIGKWDIAYRNTTDVIDEILEFSDSELVDYRDGLSAPYAASSYSWDSDRRFTAEQLSKTMEVHPLSEDCIILMETDTADIWELHRVEE